MPVLRKNRYPISPKTSTKRADNNLGFINGINNFPQFIKRVLFDVNYAIFVCAMLFIAEIFICVIVIMKVPYTEIDWKAYMEQVQTFVHGSTNYSQLNGGTGPLVYPAGHLYIYTGLYYITGLGTNIKRAQIVFALVYLLNLLLVFRIYLKWNKLPPYAYIFMTIVAYRIHSIYMLRLFNDPLAMIFLYLAVNLFITDYSTLACIVFSLSVSIKMNILLFAPAVGFVMVAVKGWYSTVCHAFMCACIQLLIGLPFLVQDPLAYLSRSFNLGRVFLYEWTVNWRFVPENVFVDRRFHIFLLFLHLTVLVIFTVLVGIRQNGGLSNFVWRKSKIQLTLEDTLLCLFASNLIGISFARSLHYQFYVWYYHSLPFLLWSTSYSPPLKICILGIIEMCWNVYPSTVYSSAALNSMHFLIITGLLYVNFKIKKKVA